MQGPRVDVHMNVYGNFCFRAQVDEISIHRLNTIILFFSQYSFTLLCGRVLGSTLKLGLYRVSIMKPVCP